MQFYLDSILKKQQPHIPCFARIEVFYFIKWVITRKQPNQLNSLWINKNEKRAYTPSGWGGGGGGGWALRYFHTYVDSDHFFGFKILNFSFLGVFRKMNIFLGYNDFVDIFLGSSQNWASLRLISMQFRVFFLRSRYRIGIFLGLLKFQIFFGGA